MKKHGFTLIELLVVIAIIAILAAILFPVFARARMKAQQTTCLSNIKELSLSVLMYVSDFDEMFPASWSTSPICCVHWDTMIFPYVKSFQLFNCPATNYAAYWTTTNGYGPYFNIMNSDYGMNGALGSNGDSGCSVPNWPVPPLKQSMVNHPSQMIMLFGTNTPSSYGYINPDCAGGGAPNIETRHNNGGNVSYCDGHAQWQSQPVLYATATGLPWDNS